MDAANLRTGEKVVIHTASGGVGSALLQYSKYMNCEVIATTSSSSKVEFLKQQGANYVINTSIQNFYQAAHEITSGDGVDVIFDALGGSFVRNGIRLLAPAGRMICYGAATLTDKSFLGKIRTVLGFGLYHPLQFMMPSKALIGIKSPLDSLEF